MQVTLDAADLRAFEGSIAAAFRAKQIRSPVHLSGGNEEHLIRIFRQHVEPEDWVLCQWRSHYHCLLKGVPQSELRRAIHDGRSISLCFPEHGIISSAIVGGTAPWATGLAWAIKRKGDRRKVVCFVGDMTFQAGVVQEAVKYSIGHSLPVLWIVEDNGVSVRADTVGTWGTELHMPNAPNVISYNWKNEYPHVGLQEKVQF